jgi:hypothetical protein
MPEGSPCDGHREAVAICSKPATVLLWDVASSYPHGKVSLIMIQFPTPFKFHWKDNGNQQLSSDEANGFIVNPECFSLLLIFCSSRKGYLLLKSNCEYLAVKMRDVAINDVVFECMNLEIRVTAFPELAESALPLRTQNWIQMGGERPIGEGSRRRR